MQWIALLKAISDKLIPGLPENLRVLLAGQVEEHTDKGSTGANQTSVIQKVMNNDIRRVELTKEYESTYLGVAIPHATILMCSYSIELCLESDTRRLKCGLCYGVGHS